MKEYDNDIEQLLNLFPDKPWSWLWLSQNPNITWEIVQANPDKPWDWVGLSLNKFDYSIRKKRDKEDKAARIIQKGCENWLWKPLCKDGTIGIMPRIAMKKLFNLSAVVASKSTQNLSGFYQRTQCYSAI